MNATDIRFAQSHHKLSLRGAPHFNCFLWALSQMHSLNKSNGFVKHYIYRVR